MPSRAWSNDPRRRSMPRRNQSRPSPNASRLFKLTQTNRNYPMARITAESCILTERLRIASIIESPEGIRNPKMAREFALRSPVDPLVARAILAQAPAASPFSDAMAGEVLGLSAMNASSAIVGGDPREARLAEI